MKVPTISKIMEDDCYEFIDGVVDTRPPKRDDVPSDTSYSNPYEEVSDGYIRNGHGDIIGVEDYNMSESKEILFVGKGEPVGYKL